MALLPVEKIIHFANVSADVTDQMSLFALAFLHINTFSNFFTLFLFFCMVEGFMGNTDTLRDIPIFLES